MRFPLPDGTIVKWEILEQQSTEDDPILRYSLRATDSPLPRELWHLAQTSARIAIIPGQGCAIIGHPFISVDDAEHAEKLERTPGVYVVPMKTHGLLLSMGRVPEDALPLAFITRAIVVPGTAHAHLEQLIRAGKIPVKDGELWPYLDQKGTVIVP